MNYRDVLLEQSILNPSIFWDITDVYKLSEEALLERLLNFGSFEQLKSVVKDIDSFRNIYSRVRNKSRCNLKPVVINYIDLYLSKNAQRSTK